MLFVSLVFIHVKPECLDAFKQATIMNASNSLNEAGVVRFDLVQQRDNPNRFVLWEVYRQPGDLDAHKQTAHYLTWRQTVESMMAEPRQSAQYNTVFPDDAHWG